MSEGSGKTCRPFSELSSGLHVIVFKGLDGCCDKEVAPDLGCRENGPEDGNMKCRAIFVSSRDSLIFH